MACYPHPRLDILYDDDGDEGYPYGGVSYSILGPNLPFLLLALLALILLLAQVSYHDDDDMTLTIAETRQLHCVYFTLYSV